MLLTSIVLPIGFFSRTISATNNLLFFGLITSLTVLFSSGFGGCKSIDESAPSKKVEETKHKNLNHSVILSSNYQFLANIKNQITISVI